MFARVKVPKRIEISQERRRRNEFQICVSECECLKRAYGKPVARGFEAR